MESNRDQLQTWRKLARNVSGVGVSVGTSIGGLGAVAVGTAISTVQGVVSGVVAGLSPRSEPAASSGVVRVDPSTIPPVPIP